MKNFNIPEWDGSKAGDKASEAFAKAGKTSAKPKKTTPKAKTTKSPDGKKVNQASKAIKKASPVKKVKAKAVSAAKQAASPVKSPRVVRARAGTTKKTVAAVTPKPATPRVTKTSPKSPNTTAKPANVKKAARKSTSSVPVINGVSPKVQRGRKHSLPQPETSATPAKVQKLAPSPKKSAKTLSDKKKPRKSPKSKSPKVPKIVVTEPTPTRPTPIKRTSLGKKLSTPAKKTTPSKAVISPAKKAITLKGATPAKRKSLSIPKAKTPRKTPSPKNTTAPSPKSAQKKSPLQVKTKSVAIKKSPKKKKPTKIKIAGLLGKKKPVSPIVNGSPGPSTSTTSGSKSPVKAPSTPAGKRDEGKKRKKLSTVLNTSGSASAKLPALPVAKKAGPKRTRARASQTPLREKMMDRLQSARFRYINEELYTKDSAGAVQLFQEDPEAFSAYHEGYRQQVKKWPMNPLTKIIAAIKKMPENFIVADFGCGDAELSKSVKQKVHSFDLVAANARVTACDMAHVPLEKHSVDVAVFCLSLMGTNLQDYLLEANRVLKVGGMLMIAEVESRFDKVDGFLTGLRRYGFNKVHQDYEHNLFYLWHLHKERDVKNKKNLPTMSLHPCLYKKR